MSVRSLASSPCHSSAPGSLGAVKKSPGEEILYRLIPYVPRPPFISAMTRGFATENEIPSGLLDQCVVSCGVGASRASQLLQATCTKDWPKTLNAADLGILRAMETCASLRKHRSKTMSDECWRVWEWEVGNLDMGGTVLLEGECKGNCRQAGACTKSPEWDIHSDDLFDNHSAAGYHLVSKVPPGKYRTFVVKTEGHPDVIVRMKGKVVLANLLNAMCVYFKSAVFPYRLLTRIGSEGIGNYPKPLENNCVKHGVRQVYLDGMCSTACQLLGDLVLRRDILRCTFMEEDTAYPLIQSALLYGFSRRTSYEFSPYVHDEWAALWTGGLPDYEEYCLRLAPIKREVRADLQDSVCHREVFLRTTDIRDGQLMARSTRKPYVKENWVEKRRGKRMQTLEDVHHLRKKIVKKRASVDYVWLAFMSLLVINQTAGSHLCPCNDIQKFSDPGISDCTDVGSAAGSTVKMELFEYSADKMVRGFECFVEKRVEATYMGIFGSKSILSTSVTRSSVELTSCIAAEASRIYNGQRLAGEPDSGFTMVLRETPRFYWCCSDSEYVLVEFHLRYINATAHHLYDNVGVIPGIGEVEWDSSGRIGKRGLESTHVLTYDSNDCGVTRLGIFNATQYHPRVFTIPERELSLTISGSVKVCGHVLNHTHEGYLLRHVLREKRSLESARDHYIYDSSIIYTDESFTLENERLCRMSNLLFVLVKSRIIDATTWLHAVTGNDRLRAKYDSEGLKVWRCSEYIGEKRLVHKCSMGRSQLVILYNGSWTECVQLRSGELLLHTNCTPNYEIARGWRELVNYSRPHYDEVWPDNVSGIFDETAGLLGVLVGDGHGVVNGTLLVGGVTREKLLHSWYHTIDLWISSTGRWWLLGMSIILTFLSIALGSRLYSCYVNRKLSNLMRSQF